VYKCVKSILNPVEWSERFDRKTRAYDHIMMLNFQSLLVTKRVLLSGGVMVMKNIVNFIKALLL